MYLIDDSVDLETILEYLERDSMVLNRQFDREKTIEIIDRIRNNDTLRINLVKWILSAIVSAGALYLFSKIINND